MKASELKQRLAKVPDDYELVEDDPVYGFVINHIRKEFTINELPDEEIKERLGMSIYPAHVLEVV